MSAAQVPLGHGSLYLNIAKYPELGLFRRLGAYWAKKVHDDTSQFYASLDKVNRQLGALPELEARSILDCPLRIVRQKCTKDPKRYKSLCDAWEEYDIYLLQFGQTLLMSEQVMKLPCQDPYYTSHLDEFKPPGFKDFFVDDVCVLTGEEAKSFKDWTETMDNCAWGGLSNKDFITMRFIRSSKWIEKHILSRLRRCSPSKKPSDPRIQTDMRHSRIVSVMDTITCLVASILILLSVLVLVWVEPLKTRVVLIGVFGTLFALALRLLAGDITRAGVFAAMAGFYAVEVAFVATTTTTTATTMSCACT